MATVGSGSHVYEIAKDWVKLPEGVKFGYTHGIVTDSQDRVYIFNTSKDAVIVLDKDGNYLNSWGEQFKDGAHGMLLNKEGDQEFLYLVDTSLRNATKTTLDGEVVMTLAHPPLPEVYTEDKPYVPTDIAVASNGDIYVSDGYGQSWVHQYTADGTYVKSWAGPAGSEPGHTNSPHGISVDTRGPEEVIYIADRSNNRIQVFTLEGEHIRFVTDEMDLPCSFFQYKDELYLPDLNSRITILDKDDKLIAHVGTGDGYKREGWPNLAADTLVEDQFSSPHGICVAANGDVYVAEWIEYGRVTKLVRQ